MRIKKLLLEIDSGKADGPPWLRQDLLVVPDQRHVGKIESSLLELKTAFGLLRVPLADVESAAPPIDTVAVDLLTKIDLQRDVVFGTWTRDGLTLVSPLQSRARLQIPVVPPADYDLRLTVVAKEPRKSGKGASPDALFITIVVAGHQCNVALNSFGDLDGGPFSGMDVVAGRRTHMSPLHRGAVLALNKEARIVIAVRGSTVDVALNDNHLFRWKGDPAKLSVDKGWRLKNARYLGIGEHQTGFRISRCELLPWPKRPVKVAPAEVMVRLSDGSFLSAKIDDGQTIVVEAGGAERNVSAESLAEIRPEPNQKGFRITLTAGESFVVEKLPRQAIHLTTRFGKLAPPLDQIATLERME